MTDVQHLSDGVGNPTSLEIRATYADGRTVAFEYPHGVDHFDWVETVQRERVYLPRFGGRSAVPATNPVVSIKFVPITGPDGIYATIITNTDPKDLP